MFTVFINLVFFAILYSIYLLLKSKIYVVRKNETLNTHDEILIFPLALYIYFLFASMQFQMLGDSGISFIGLANLAHLNFIPFEDWFWQYDFSRFMNHVYTDYNTWPTSLLNTLLQNFGFHLAFLIPVSFALKSICHTWKKALFFFISITILVGLQNYELNVGTIIVTGLIAFVIGNFLSDFVIFFINKKSSLQSKLELISIYTALLLPLVLFTFNMNILAPQSGRIQNMSFSTQESFKTFDQQISITPLEYSKENNKNLHITFTLTDLPEPSFPYVYNLRSINYRLETDGKLNLLSDAPIQPLQDAKEQPLTSSLYINNIEYNTKFISKNIYPVKFYGIESLTYASTDPTLLSQLEVLDTKWIKDEYDCYQITYRVPLLSQQEANWQINITYDNPLLKGDATTGADEGFYNSETSPTLYGQYDLPVLISEDSTYKTYMLKCYFYQYGHGAFSKKEIKNIETICWNVLFDLSPESKSEVPIWIIDADTLK